MPSKTGKWSSMCYESWWGILLQALREAAYNNHLNLLHTHYSSDTNHTANSANDGIGSEIPDGHSCSNQQQNEHL